MNLKYSEVIDFFTERDNFLIVCHKRPDGDTLGSAVAIMYSFPEKNIMIACDDEIPSNLAFLFDKQVIGFDEYLEKQDSFKYIVAVDIATPDLSGRFENTLCEKCDLKIDHHGTGSDYGKFGIVDSAAAAAGEIVFDILNSAKKINKRSAQALYTAISTDTGCFKYTNTTSDTFRRTAALIELGAENGKLNNILFESKTLSQTRAIKCAYSSLEFFADGRAAITFIDNKTKEKYSLRDNDLSEINGISRAIEGVVVGASVKQCDGEDRKFKISLRSDGSVDCSKLCKTLGGGGHIGAAGASIEAVDITEACDIVKKIVSEALDA